MGSAFALSFMRMAGAAGLFASVALGSLGVYMMYRRMVFVGLALAQVATLGAAVGTVLGWPATITALVATIIAATGLGLLNAPRGVPSEAVVGWSYAFAAAGTILVLARSALGHEYAMDLLFGNILFVTQAEVWALGGVAILVVATLGLWSRQLLAAVVDPESARAAGLPSTRWILLLHIEIGVAVAVSLTALGALVTFGLLVLPAVLVLLLARRAKGTVIRAATIAAGASALTLLLSYRWDLPTGPLTVCGLALLAAPAFALKLARTSRD
jgi:ABC-type Mn2+/Zn2+ transport system permease subunit